MPRHGHAAAACRHAAASFRRRFSTGVSCVRCRHAAAAYASAAMLMPRHFAERQMPRHFAITPIAAAAAAMLFFFFFFFFFAASRYICFMPFCRYATAISFSDAIAAQPLPPRDAITPLRRRYFHAAFSFDFSIFSIRHFAAMPLPFSLSHISAISLRHFFAAFLLSFLPFSPLITFSPCHFLFRPMPPIIFIERHACRFRRQRRRRQRRHDFFAFRRMPTASLRLFSPRRLSASATPCHYAELITLRRRRFR
jgi:hypothetical protein